MNSQPHVLIVDDDPEIRSLLARYLGERGFRVTTASNRRECERHIQDRHPDVLVLDVMLPDGSGLDICRALHERRSRIPTILLTALKEDVDRIIGLEIGADDYLGKPFNPRELVARMKAVLRRTVLDTSAASEYRIYNFAGLEADPEQRRLSRENGDVLDLTGAEFDLLRVFLERPGRLLSREQLLDFTQGRDRDPMDRSIDVLMSRLRRKLGDSEAGPMFKTIRNGGYQLTVPVKASVVPR